MKENKRWFPEAQLSSFGLSSSQVKAPLCGSQLLVAMTRYLGQRTYKEERLLLDHNFCGSHWFWYFWAYGEVDHHGGVCMVEVQAAPTHGLVEVKSKSQSPTSSFRSMPRVLEPPSPRPFLLKALTSNNSTSIMWPFGGALLIQTVTSGLLNPCLSTQHDSVLLKQRYLTFQKFSWR